MTEKFANPKPKTWWTKRILSDGFYSAGRLDERQLKYAAEGGFPTIISLFSYPDVGDQSTYDPRFDLPTTSQSKRVIARFNDVTFEVLLDEDGDWKTEEALLKLKEIVESRPKPILLYCNNSYASTFLLLAYFGYVTSHSDDDRSRDRVPDVSDKDVFRIGAQLGYDYGADPDLVQLISRLTGNARLRKTPSPDTTVHSWYDVYWIMKPVYKQFFVCGQFQTNDVRKLAKVGLSAIVNCRGEKPRGTGKPEEVSLLNISGGVDLRADLSSFLPKRISPTRPNSHISKRSPVNYEFINPLEFGDAEGYNPETERRHVTKFMFSTRYVHIPIDLKTGYTINTWKQYLEFINNHHSSGPILIHCRTGFRAGRLAFMAAAYAYHQSSKWALDRALLVGYKLANDNYNKLLQDQLDKDAAETGEEKVV